MLLKFYAAITLAISSICMNGEPVTIPSGIPLRIRVDHRYRVRVDKKIDGRLVASTYSGDQEVLPVNIKVFGTIQGEHRPDRRDRVKAILDGEIIPAAVPEVRFDSLQMPDGEIVPIHTTVTERDAMVVRMSVSKNRSKLTQQVRDMIQDRRREALDVLRHPNIGDRIEKWTYSQLPWHPNMIWAGTQYDAELSQPVQLAAERQPSRPLTEINEVPTGIIRARLTVGLDSGKDKVGTPVRAVLTEPLLTPDQKQVIFPEGASLTGTVTFARPARWFARNGRLRFTFRSLQMERRPQVPIHGQLAASEVANQQNLKINEEGTAESTSGPGKYLVPMALSVLTAASYGDDATRPVNNAAVSGGFGLAARIAAATAANPSVGRGFAYYALSKSIYFRWIARGYDVQFPKNTRLEILLNKR